MKHLLTLLACTLLLAPCSSLHAQISSPLITGSGKSSSGGIGSTLWTLQGNSITQADTSHSVGIQDSFFIIAGSNSSYFYPAENSFSIGTATDTTLYSQNDTLIETIAIRSTGAISSMHHSGGHLELNVRDAADSTSSILHIHGNEGFIFEKDLLTGTDSIIFQIKTDTRQIQYYKDPCAGCILADDGAGLGILEYVTQASISPWTLSGTNVFLNDSSNNVNIGRSADPTGIGFAKLYVRGTTWIHSADSSVYFQIVDGSAVFEADSVSGAPSINAIAWDGSKTAYSEMRTTMSAGENIAYIGAYAAPGPNTLSEVSCKNSGVYFRPFEISTTAGDAATLNKIHGRFRKDTSGSTFTLTNSYITANSTVVVGFLSDPGATGYDMPIVVPGSGSAVITFKTAGAAAAPANNTDCYFLVIN